MLPIVREVAGSRFLIADVVASVVLALSPVIIKLLIFASYDRSDTYGSGADPFVWFYFVMWALGGYLAVQAIFFITFRVGSVRAKLFILLGTIPIWMISIISLRLV